jgi:putative ATPase
MKSLGHGREYRYPHDEPEGFAAGVSYWPEDLEVPVFYQPVPRGLELRIGERLSEWRRLQAKAKMESEGPAEAS